MANKSRLAGCNVGYVHKHSDSMSATAELFVRFV